MAFRGKIFSFALTLALIVLAFFAMGQISSSMGNAEELSQLQQRSDELVAGIAEQEETKSTLASRKTEQEQDLLMLRNADGRASMNGDGAGKVCYLTFDDGPSKDLTPKVLDVLDEHDACGTWFCMGSKKIQYLDLSLLKEIESRGNAVGIHDWNQASHYNYYRGSVQDYFDTDFDKTKKNIEKELGHEVKIMRFAGGSATIGYVNKNLATALPREMVERGYQFFDWNVMAGDSDPTYFVGNSAPAETLVSNVLNEAQYYADKDSSICVLMHDNSGKDTTVEALPGIIEGLREMGYVFKPLTVDSPGFYQVSLM